MRTLNCLWGPRFSVKRLRASAQQQEGEPAKDLLLPAEHSSLHGEDLRLLYLSHLLAPFCVASVWDTALKVQTLFLSTLQPSSWEPTAAGVSLRIRQALKTPRAWVLLGLGALNACASGLLLTLWRLTIPLDQTFHLELTTVFSGLFGMMAPAFWSAFTASGSSFAALMLNQTVGTIACACAAAAPSGGPGFSAMALATALSFFVGSTATLPRFVAIAFGPHRLAFLLFGFASVSLCLGLLLAVGLVEATFRFNHGMEYLFSGVSIALGCSILAFVAARCYRRRLGRILDLPSAYHVMFNDVEEGDDESGELVMSHLVSSISAAHAFCIVRKLFSSNAVFASRPGGLA